MIPEVRGFHLPFDSVIQGDTLTLVVHANLVPTRGTTVRTYWDGSQKTTLDWPEELWQVWPARWKRAILDAWHDKFELHSAVALQRASDPHVLKCHLELHVKDVDGSFRYPGHLRSRCDFFGRAEGDLAISSVDKIGGNPVPGGWDMTMDYRDIVGDDKSRALPGAGVQYAAIHEFGHFLGLFHRCQTSASQAGSTHSNAYCGGGTVFEVTDTMSGGNDMRPWHAEPWLRRLHAHQYHQDVPWWAVVKGGSERTVPIYAGTDDRASNIQRQDMMKTTAGLDSNDAYTLAAPTPSGSNAQEAMRVDGLTHSVQTGLGLPLQ